MYAHNKLVSSARFSAICYALSLLFPLPAHAFDTDLFTVGSNSLAPNVLIVLDNTSNWSRNDEKFPDGNGGTITQGQAEVNAIKSVIQSLTGYINVGMLEFVTGGNANDLGGYVRYAVSPMGSSQTNGPANQTAFSTQLTTIYNNITSPNEKQNSGSYYGDLMYDAYNYFGGLTPKATSADVVSSLADSNGYVTNYTKFKTPLSSSTICSSNYIVFIGNPPSSGPTNDTAANLTALSTVGGNTSQLKLQNYSSTTLSVPTNLGYSNSCFTSQPSGTPVDYTSACSAYDSCSYSTTDTTTALPACSTGQSRYAVQSTGGTTTTGPTAGTATTSSAATTVCYSGVSTGSNKWSTSSDNAGLTCPSTSTSTNGNTTTTTTYSCTYTGALGSTTGCAGTSTLKNHINVTQTATPSVSTSTTVSSGTLGNSFACYGTAPSGTVASTDLPATGCPSGATCSYGSATTNNSCPTGGSRYQALGYTNTITTVPTGTTSTDTATYNADEWARFLYQKGVPVSGSSTNATVTTFAIDVYGIKPNGVQSSLLNSMATNGGGRYFQATNASQITTALKNIFSEIQATNSTFASAALPIAATNRTQNDNQVYIGMFRPDQQSLPRWFGNLKRYQFGVVNGATTLVDANNSAAVSTTSGFLSTCAQSYWTTDSGNYWANVDSSNNVSPRVYFTTTTSAGTAWTTQGDDTNLAAGQCNTLGAKYSDLPDGPNVEKGGAAEKLRNGSSRTIKTYSGGSVVDFNTSNVTLSSNSTVNTNLVNFIKGQDVTGEINATASTTNRASIHGDVIHSKPLAVDFGGSTGVNVYYGANDGTYRSVNATTGAENWAFIAPESYSTLQRLMDNTPVVKSPNPTPSGSTAASGTAKDFFFDGSTGLYQNSDSSKVWIYPSMRRGGRVIYSFDVSPGSSAAAVKWKFGCPNLTNDTGCADGQGANSTSVAGIGQTWSTPNVAFLSGYSSTTPAVIFGGGYDSCEDADSVPSASGFCSSPKGAKVYVVDGDTGAVIKAFSTDRSIAADTALVDANSDGTVDLAYVADTGGNIYRINFSDPSNNYAALASNLWTITKIAYTNGSNRKFLFAPTLLAYKNDIYVAIGSGDREHPLAASYPFTTPVVNRFYVYLDDPTQSTAIDMDSTSNFYDYTVSSSDTCSSPGVLPGGTKKGWFINLNENGTGEQTVTSSLILGGLVSFSTNRPINGAVCSQDLGEARGYTVNLINASGAIGVTGTCGGNRSSVFVGGGLPPSPVSGIVTINGVPQIVEIGTAQKDGTTSTPISPQKVTPPINPKRKRLYWRIPTDTH